MDLLDFEGENLYFEEPLAPAVGALLEQAGRLYGTDAAEPLLLEARRLAPESLTVLVAVYRFHYYQRQLEAALAVAAQALAVTARRLGIPLDWERLGPEHLGQGGPAAMALVRFHLLALKAQAYLLLRLDRVGEGRAILTRLSQLDTHNRLGARQLLDVAAEKQSGR